MALSFRNISIRKKLMLIIMTVSGITLILSCTAYLSFEYKRAQEEMVREVQIMGEVLGQNNTSPILFYDTLTSTQSLKTLVADNNIDRAVIFDADGNPFSRYIRPGLSGLGEIPDIHEGYIFNGDQLDVFIPIAESGENIGTIYLQTNLTKLHSSLRRSVIVILIILAVSLVVVYLVSLRLQQFISDPILKLANTARRISKDKDYSIRIDKRGDDEVGVLIDGFNEMLGAVDRGNKALQESEERYRTIVENAHDLIYRTNYQGDFTYVNPIAKRMTGYSEKEMMQMNYMDVIHPDSRDSVLGFYRNQLLNLVPTSYFEFQIRTKDGKDIWIGQNVEATIEKNKVLEFQAVARDITERVKAEEALTIAKEQAESATQAKSTFLANMSHEIRTPMNGVMGMARLLEDTSLTNEQMEYVQAINISAENLLTIINDVLDFSKIEAGKVVLEKATFSLRDFMKSVERSLKILSDQKALELAVDISSDIPDMLVGDRVRLNQILVNLVGNAVKFTEKGGVSVAVNLMKRKGNKLCIYFQVTDTGIGIPDNKIESIFSSFEQASGDTTRKYGGTGLGLSISKELVGLFGGQINVESREGLGSSFTFSVWMEEASVQHSSREEKSASGEDYDVLKGRKVLVVEDNKINQMLAKKVLSKWGMEVTLADNGALGVEQVQGDGFELVLMDIQMPEMDGYQATAAIRKLADAGKSGLPVLAITAHAAPEEREKCLKAGMNDYISKPFNETLLKDKIVCLLQDASKKVK
ncbi:MAG: PAS domain S-box protein [Flavobacteriales bacterium]|nr:PAS domain S-box protein [Flavobacteriales bacterium]